MYMRMHDVESHVLTIESTLQNNHKLGDRCSKLSLTKFREVLNGTIDIWLPLDVVSGKRESYRNAITAVFKCGNTCADNIRTHCKCSLICKPLTCGQPLTHNCCLICAVVQYNTDIILYTTTQEIPINSKL
jgi:hypothetical protein